MDARKVELFLATNKKYFDKDDIAEIRLRMLNVEDSKLMLIQTLRFRDPVMMFIISFLGGGFGIDRFMLGDTGIGVGKLLTCGGGGIWALIDLFLIMGVTKEKNMKKLRPFLF